MTVHFAASRSGNAPIARILRRRAPARAANDNGLVPETDRLLHEALRHFARHGIGAAREARHQAERAFFAGDRATYDWWLGICRTLDRRLASGLEQSTQPLPLRPAHDG